MWAMVEPHSTQQASTTAPSADGNRMRAYNIDTIPFSRSKWCLFSDINSLIHFNKRSRPDAWRCVACRSFNGSFAGVTQSATYSSSNARSGSVNDAIPLPSLIYTLFTAEITNPSRTSSDNRGAGAADDIRLTQPFAPAFTHKAEQPPHKLTYILAIHAKNCTRCICMQFESKPWSPGGGAS
jgi:hypothetical protein